MTRGENQGNKVRIAQAQEKGHKDEQCGACSGGRDGIWGWTAGQASGSGSLEVHGDPGAQATLGGEGVWAQRWTNTEGQGKGKA